MLHSEPGNLQFEQNGSVLVCSGDWTLVNLPTLQKLIHSFTEKMRQVHTIKVDQIHRIDSAGVLFLYQFIKKFNPSLKPQGFSKAHQTLFNLILKDAPEAEKVLPQRKKHNQLDMIGYAFVQKCYQIVAFFTFIGELAINFVYLFKHTRVWRWRSMLNIVETNGYQALPIIALMSFLIGIVLAYQLGIQLETYGVNVFVVDITGIAVLREFAPLITAVIMAGRTSTSFAALIGTMKVNEELDALNTANISPIECLVIPRIIGLVIVLPLLTVWADVFGVLGSMVMAKHMLHIDYHSFLVRFSEKISVRHYVLGLVKVPVFALIIALVGCFQGFRVTYNAESVGKQTTKAAVQAIFLIIIADALFSIIFSWHGV